MSNQEQRLQLSNVHEMALVVEGHKTDKFLLVEGVPTKLFTWPDSDELYVPIKDGPMILYKEHLDGPLMDLVEAMEKYPEYFV